MHRGHYQTPATSLGSSRGSLAISQSAKRAKGRANPTLHPDPAPQPPELPALDSARGGGRREGWRPVPTRAQVSRWLHLTLATAGVPATEEQWVALAVPACALLLEVTGSVLLSVTSSLP